MEDEMAAMIAQHRSPELGWFGWFLHSLDPRYYQTALVPESGFTFNEDCDPLEYDCLGKPVIRTQEELGIITEYEDACLDVIRPEMELRKTFNDKRMKADAESINGLCLKYPFYDAKDIKHIRLGFLILDENDDLLVDRKEFLEALGHFNDVHLEVMEDEKELAIFDIIDTENYGVMDFEGYLQITAYIDKKMPTPKSLQNLLPNSIVAAYVDTHQRNT
jgi:hypothetical protein